MWKWWMSIAVSLASISALAAPPDKWDVANSQIRRLAPSAFSNLPQNIIRYLEAEGCTIPQTYSDKKAHNVINGHFSKKGQIDWAVLCSKGGVSSILVFWNGATNGVSEINKSADRGFLQGTGYGIGYSRAINTVGRSYIEEMWKEFGGPKPHLVDHDGIDDAFIEKASGIFYYDQGKWMGLQGAD